METATLERTDTTEAQSDAPHEEQAAPQDSEPEQPEPEDTRSPAQKLLDELKANRKPLTEPVEVDGQTLHCMRFNAPDIMWIHIQATLHNEGKLDFTNREVLRRFVSHSLYCAVLKEPLDYRHDDMSIAEQDAKEDAARYFSSPDEAALFFDEPATASMIDVLFDKVTAINPSFVKFL